MRFMVRMRKRLVVIACLVVCFLLGTNVVTEMFENKIWDFGYVLIVSGFVTGLLAVFWAVSIRLEANPHKGKSNYTFRQAMKNAQEQIQHEVEDKRLGIFVRILCGAMAIALATGLIVILMSYLHSYGTLDLRSGNVWACVAAFLIPSVTFAYLAIVGYLGLSRKRKGQKDGKGDGKG